MVEQELRALMKRPISNWEDEVVTGKRKVG